MGLDIYLYSVEQRRQNDAYEKASEEWYAEGPDGASPWDRATEDERSAWRAEHAYASSRDVPSERYPDHLFNRRYLRSSYNDGGFNHAVPDFLATTSSGTRYPDHEGSLYWIFEPMGREWDGDEGTLTADDVPKLAECRARALDVAERLRKVDPLRVAEEGNVFTTPRMKPADFLAWYRKQQVEREALPSPFGGGYSTRDGTVFGFDKGLEVLAVTVGIGTLGEPAALVVYRSEHVESYIQSAEIVAEFCDEAVMLIERDGSCTISWSG